jgi:AraC-like DNA-binding protein
VIFEAHSTTPADVIRKTRIERAGFLLRDPDYGHFAISDISFMTGFSDVTTFTRAFRRYFGATPREWRGA